MNFLQKNFGRLGNSMFQYAALYAWSKDLGIDYYFQDEKWFKKYQTDILKMFGGGIGFDDRVSIHVRRTDMTTNNFDINLSETDYYEKAIARFPKERFLIFSDDMNWCLNKWAADIRFDFAQHNDEVTDLKLMASCKSNIIANSSFSWWAAYLNPNPNKVVICPEFEYLDHKERRIRPQQWIRI
jgi:hypothetical protein